MSKVDADKLDLENDKLALLELYFPSIHRSVLVDLLDSCNGSVTTTKSLIEGNVINDQQSDNNDNDDNTSVKHGKRKVGTLYQSSIHNLLLKSSSIESSTRQSIIKPIKKQKCTSSNPIATKIITLNTPEQVKEHLSPYVSLHKNFLPSTVADDLLVSLDEQKHKVTPNEFYLFDKKCKSNHSLAFFHKPADESSGLNTTDVIYNGTNSKSDDKVYDSNLSKVNQVLVNYLNDIVIPNSPKLSYQSNEYWSGNACVVNYYQSLSNNLDWHSDRLNYIGPHNYVASISLGSTRYFRLRKNYGSTGVTGNSKVIYQIPLPHNTLLIMHPGCQEEYRHCVNPMAKAEQLNDIVGNSRFNLTFRFHPPKYVANLPKCKCDLSMTLRRSYKTVEKRGNYFWSCENKYQNKDCGTFHWADFKNWSNHFVATSTNNVSCWFDDDDWEKWKYLETL